MIYVILSAGFKKDSDTEFIKLLKIGYTGDDKKDGRYYQYISHNPTVKILYEIPDGTEEIEDLLHSYFSKYRYSEYGKEWFEWNEKIIEFFEVHKTVDDLLKVIDFDLKKGNNKYRFNGFNKYVYDLIDTCLNYKLSIDYDYNLKLAMQDRKNCFDEIDSSGLILREGIHKTILKYFNISLDKYEEYKKCPIPENIKDFISIFNTLPTFYDKMKAICESPFTESERKIILEQIPITFKNLYNQVGPVVLKACGYNITNIRKRLETAQVNEEKQEDIKDLIYKNFDIGEKYSLSYIKTKLGELYKEVGYLSSPKAIDLEEYFEVKKVLLPNKISNKRDSAYEILSKKD